MKKFFVFLILGVVLLLICACKKIEGVVDPKDVNEDNTVAATSHSISSETASSLPVISQSVSANTTTTIVLNTLEDYCTDGEANYKRSYRLIFYRIPIELINLAGQDGYDFVESAMSEYTSSEPKEMIIALFVKHFNIPKDQFINLFEDIKASRLESGLDVTNEEYEIPNAEIIYTFDNETINEYYSRK